MIYRKTEHTALAGGPWDERLARYAIADIVDEAVAAGPSDEAGIYAGVAGQLYALRALGKDVDWEPGAGDGPGFADGEVGIALVLRDKERFRAAAPACIDDPWNELLYGAGGALVAARLLGEDDIAREAIKRLWSTWTFDSKLRACIWTQEYNGKRTQISRVRARRGRQRVRASSRRAATEPRAPDGADPTHSSRRSSGRRCARATS